jgi:Putative Ig domain
MDRAPFFAGTQLRHFRVRVLAGAALCVVSVAAQAADALKISGSPSLNAGVGKTYSFTPTVSDPSKKTLKFTIVNRPKWATFSATTGHLTGTPTAAALDADIVISVTDGAATSYLPGFSIRVWPAASTTDKPVISGTPATKVTAGSTYRFQPTAKDPDGKTLSFSITHKPAWATFSISSGLLDGTPSSSQTGAYDDVVISASNGTSSSSLPAFNITVAAASSAPTTGTAQLKWVLPTENTNGSKLTDLAGVRIYYGTSKSDLADSVELAGTSTTSYTVSGLSAGTWYFGAEAYTTTGESSKLSSVVSKTVQ